MPSEGMNGSLHREAVRLQRGSAALSCVELPIGDPALSPSPLPEGRFSLRWLHKDRGKGGRRPETTWPPCEVPSGHVGPRTVARQGPGVLGVAQIAVPGVGDEERILLRGVLCCFIFTRVVGRLEGVPSSFCIARGPGNWPG